MEAFASWATRCAAAILELLADGERSSGEVTETISAEFGIGQPGSMQLRVLRESGFADVRPDGARAVRPQRWSDGRARRVARREVPVVWEQHLDALGTEIARGRSDVLDVAWPWRSRDDFDGRDLDTSVWLPHYLPMWSSREATRASYRLEDSCLVLDIPPDHGLWLPEDHPLRCGSPACRAATGPGRSAAPRPAAGVRRTGGPRGAAGVRRPPPGRAVDLEIRCRMTLSPRSMAALWLCGFEDEPERCGGDLRGRGVRQGRRARRVRRRSASASSRSATLTWPRTSPLRGCRSTSREFHTYAVDWDADEAVFTVDGEEVRRCAGPPVVPAAADGRRLRLPRLEHGRRRPPGARAGWTGSRIRRSTEISSSRIGR